jgi:hypothetical protein
MSQRVERGGIKADTDILGVDYEEWKRDEGIDWIFAHKNRTLTRLERYRVYAVAK